MRDMEALRVFETPRPKSGHKYGAVVSLLQRGVDRVGIEAMIDRAPWPAENREKWRAQLRKLAGRIAVCPFCRFDPDPDCRVSEYLGTAESRYAPLEVALLG